MKMRVMTLSLVLSSLAITGCPQGDEPGDPNDSAASPWGVCAHLPDDATLDLIAAAGIKWVRTSVNWDGIEPQRGVRFWEFLDERIAAMRERNLCIFATINRTPSWASGTNDTADPPLDPNDWRSFVAAVVTRYQDNIQYWGMWNEPNGGDEEYWTGTPAEYRDVILIPGSEAAKAVDPSCYVVGPGVTVHTNWSIDWMNIVMAEGGSEAIDIVDLHVYTTNADEVFWNIDERYENLDDIMPVRNVMRVLGIEDKPFWLSETGWPTAGERSVSEDVQADYYEALITGIQERSDTIERVFFYEMIDDPEEDRAFGALNSDYTPKPAYNVIKELLTAADVD